MGVTKSGGTTPLQQQPTGWRWRWLGLRNRLIADPIFQSGIARWPVIRWITRRRAARAFDLVAGFAYSQVLLAMVESGLLAQLAAGPCNTASASRFADLSEAATLCLLRAAVALDLVEPAGPGWWMLGEQGAALQANPGALAMVRHHRLLYADLADPLALLRQDRREPTELSAFWTYAMSQDDDTAERYSTLMAASQAPVSREAIDAYNFSRHRRLLDLGGGLAMFASAVAGACPDVEIGVFDLPAVLVGAARRLQATGLSTRITLHPGNFFHSPLPTDYDCITLVRILHDHDDAACQALLDRVRLALPQGGRLVIIEPLAQTPGARAMGGAYFGPYLWAMNSGRPRTAAEYGAMLRTAGFSTWRQTPTAIPLITSVIVSS